MISPCVVPTPAAIKLMGGQAAVASYCFGLVTPPWRGCQRFHENHKHPRWLDKTKAVIEHDSVENNLNVPEYGSRGWEAADLFPGGHRHHLSLHPDRASFWRLRIQNPELIARKQINRAQRWIGLMEEENGMPRNGSPTATFNDGRGGLVSTVSPKWRSRSRTNPRMR